MSSTKKSMNAFRTFLNMRSLTFFSFSVYIRQMQFFSFYVVHEKKNIAATTMNLRKVFDFGVFLDCRQKRVESFFSGGEL
jgi:hypothetical protein